MSKQVIATEKAPSAIGPYSQAIEGNGTIYVSGQIPVDPATGEFAGSDIASQTRQALKNVQAILEQAGSSMENIMKTTVYLKDIAEFTAMNEVYAEFFTGDYPARAAFQVAALPKDAKVEIEAIALK